MIFLLRFLVFTILSRFPRHEPAEDAVLVRDELDVCVQLEGDIPGVPTADVDFVRLKETVQNFEHALYAHVPPFPPIFFSAFLPMYLL
jgi:hypothetical protein